MIEINIFYDHTLMDLAYKASAIDFVCLTPFQQVLNDIWFERINPHVSNLRIILPYFFFPLLILPISFFRSDNIELINWSELDEKSSRLSVRYF
jgi:hypothetical protein